MPISETLKIKAIIAIKEMMAEGQDKKEIPEFEKIFVFCGIGKADNHELIGSLKVDGDVFFIAKEL